MNTPSLAFPLFGYDYLLENEHSIPNLIKGSVQIHQFPDGESLVTINENVRGQDIVFVCSLDQPNTKILPLLFAARTARSLGAKTIGLIAPYLAYMRQDKVFHPGEGITSRYFADLLSAHFDWITTVDPHLHRWHQLSDVYTIPSECVSATGLISKWIVTSIKKPVLVGPDEESAQWVSVIAEQCKAPFVILEKKRHGDEDIEVSASELSAYKYHTPILVDDIISTAATMIDTVLKVTAMGMQAPVCIGVHAVFAGRAYEHLQASGAAKIITCNTIPHPSNGIDISGILKRCCALRE